MKGNLFCFFILFYGLFLFYKYATEADTVNSMDK